MKVGVSPGPREKICIMRNQSGSLKGKKGQKWTGKVIFLCPRQGEHLIRFLDVFALYTYWVKTDNTIC